MKKYLVYVGMIALATFSSCKEKDKDPQYPVSYFEEEVTNISDLRFFTKNGEINNSGLSIVYKKRYEQLNILPMKITGGNKFLTYLSADTVQFVGESEKRYVKRRDGKILYYSPSRPMIPLEPAYNFFKYYDYGIPFFIPEEKLYYRQTIVPAKDEGNSIEFFVMAYALTKTGPSGDFYSGIYTKNVFNEFSDLELKLKNSDTLAIMTYSVKVKKE